MRRLALYIDGFNFYHAVNDLGQPHLKWVNLYAVAREIAYPDEEVTVVRYFSAFATWLPSSYSRHKAYVAALKANDVECVMAHFKDRHISCRACKRQWVEHEEKETDVHLALRILADAEDDIFDRAVLLTADSDLVPVVRLVKERHPVRHLSIAAPPGRYPSGRHLHQVADSYFELRKGRLARCLLPGKVVDSSGRVVAVRPDSYAPPRA